ncbi:MAG: TMEM43 family protein [Myxococcales bacterium]|nr:TMEM43 family protein [Myxococcales bacterium]MCB9534120.1 TMEM43 family protein [Myxococcales bacterium]
MAVTRTTSTGFLGNLKSAIISVPIGILLFLASFAVLFKNEGCTEWGEVARKSVVAAPDQAGHAGEFVSVTGTLASSTPLGDPDFLAPGPWVTISRVAEQYAWVEHSSSETRDKVGGGTETVTTYTYDQEWTSSPPDSSRFQETQGHQNVPMRYNGQDFAVDTVTVGAWSVSVPAARMPSGNLLALGAGAEAGSVQTPGVQLLGKAASATVAGTYIYMDGSATAPRIGEHRISFRVVPTGITVTGFGDASGAQLVAHDHKGDTFLRVIEGDRDAAIASLDLEDAIRKWGLRLAGFLMMWIGLQMVFAPIQAVAGILPIAKKASGFLIALVCFAVAAPLSIVTIIVSMILHSLVAVIIVALLTAGGGYMLWKRRKEGGGGAMPPGAMNEPMGPPPGAPPMGPPPGAPPMGPPPGPPPA